eukprot:1995617-Rhodomonas_salina.2
MREVSTLLGTAQSHLSAGHVQKGQGADFIDEFPKGGKTWWCDCLEGDTEVEEDSTCVYAELLVVVHLPVAHMLRFRACGLWLRKADFSH